MKLSRKAVPHIFKISIQRVEVDLARLVEGRGLDRAVARVAHILETRKEAREIDIALSGVQSPQIAPIHIAAGVVVYMYMAYTPVAPELHALGGEDVVELTMERRHLRIEGKANVGLGGEPVDVTHRVSAVADDIFDCETEPERSRDRFEPLCALDVVVDMTVGNPAVPEVQNKQPRAKLRRGFTVQSELTLGFGILAHRKQLADSLFAVQRRYIQSEPRDVPNDLAETFVPAVVDHELVSIKHEPRREFFEQPPVAPIRSPDERAG